MHNPGGGVAADPRLHNALIRSSSVRDSPETVVPGGITGAPVLGGSPVMTFGLTAVVNPVPSITIMLPGDPSAPGTPSAPGGPGIPTPVAPGRPMPVKSNLTDTKLESYSVLSYLLCDFLGWVDRTDTVINITVKVIAKALITNYTRITNRFYS